MPTRFLLYINDFPDDALCNITIHAEDTTLYTKCGEASDVGKGKKQYVDFHDGKNNIDLFDRSNNSGAIEMKIDGSVS